MKKHIGTSVVICFILLFVNVFSITVNADDYIPPVPFYIVSEDGTKVFHVALESIREDLITWDIDDFPATGLYYNADPLIPIYLVESPFEGSVRGYLWEQDFIFSRDMRYFVWIPSTNATTHDPTTTTALVFYANGIAQKTYMVSDLVYDADAVRWTVTTAEWMYNRHQTTVFDAQTNLLTIQTVDGQTHVFDITSGEIIGTNNSPYQFSWFQFTALIVIGIVVLIGGISFLRVKRRRTK